MSNIRKQKRHVVMNRIEMKNKSIQRTITIKTT